MGSRGREGGIHTRRLEATRQRSPAQARPTGRQSPPVLLQALGVQLREGMSWSCWPGENWPGVRLLG